MLNLDNLSVSGANVITNRRAFNTDDDKAVRTAPTVGKITLSDGFVAEAGWGDGDRVVSVDMPDTIAGVAIQYPFSSTNADGKHNLIFGLSKGRTIEESGFGNLLRRVGAGLDFTTSACWEALRGNKDVSRFYKAVPVYGFAIIANETQDAVAEVIAVTPDNFTEVGNNHNFAGAKVVHVSDDSLAWTTNAKTIEQVMSSQPVYALQFTGEEAKTVKSKPGTTKTNADGETFESFAEAEGAGAEELTFD